MRSPNRLHDRHSFFKYMSAATANIVLRHGTLRWSSPILFNDPFDVPRELSFGLRADDIVRALGRRIASLIESPPQDTTSLEPGLRLVVDTVKSGIADELKQKLLAGLDDVSTWHRPSGESMEALRQLWREWLPDHRILCLTESPAHAAMWYHYAEKYGGVVLEFGCVDDLDSAWLAAKPITYPLPKPAVYTADGWAELLTMPGQSAIQTILHTATYTKSPDWSYEGEWRVASFKRPTDTGNFTDYRFDPRELIAVYFGPKTSADDRQSLVSAAGTFPEVKLWDTAVGMTREFAFSEADA